MDLDARPLRCFIAVSETRSFSAAAQVMNVTQPTLSAQIRNLEQHLGFELFTRTTRRVELTPQGEAFLPSAERMVAESDRLKRSAESLRRSFENRLSLGAPYYTFDIPERMRLIEGFMETHPEIALDVDASWQHKMMPSLRSGELDFLLAVGMRISRRLADQLEKGPKIQEHLYPDDLKELVLREERVGLLVPKEMDIAQYETIPLAALKGHKIAMISDLHGDPITEPIAECLERAGAQTILPPEPHSIGIERYGRRFRIPAVTLGWFGPQDGGDGSMIRRDVEGLDITTSLTLLCHRDMSSPAIDAFWRFTEDLKAGSAAYLMSSCFRADIPPPPLVFREKQESGAPKR